MKTRIRAATSAADARAIATIHSASWRETYRGILPRVTLKRMNATVLTRRWKNRIAAERDNPSKNVWVIEDEGERVVGYSLLGPCLDDESLAGFAGEVFMLYIHPKHIGRGFGRALLEHSLEVLSERGYYWCVIWVLKHNDKARAFYSRIGLRPDGQIRWDRFSGEHTPVLRYAMALNPVVDFARLGLGDLEFKPE